MESRETSYCLVYVTAGGQEEAERLAKVVLENRLAACANIYAPIRSVYWWEGRLEASQEAVLILKAPESAYEAIEQVVVAHHSYQTPAILQIPIVRGLPSFLAWIAEETHTAMER